MIKCAEQSPRICKDGSIRWYEGDTFELEFELEFTDENDNPIEALPNDQITICFRNKINLDIVYETNVIGTNKLKVCIDDEATKKFKVGEYYYCVRRNSKFITTLMRNNTIVVE